MPAVYSTASTDSNRCFSFEAHYADAPCALQPRSWEEYRPHMHASAGNTGIASR
jgi:hypothetical protein